MTNRVLALLLLAAGAQGAELQVVDRLSVNGSVLFRSSATWGGMAAPPQSASGRGAIYFDSSSGKFKVSENGGSYSSLAGYWTPSASDIYSVNSGNVGIGTS